MSIHKIEVLGYKCLRYVTQELRPFQILVGPNASGKSTFLDVLVFLQDLLRDGLEGAVEKRARSVRELTWKMESEHFELAVELALPDSVRERLALPRKSGGERSKEPYSKIRYEVRVGTDPEGVLSLRVENLFLLREERDTEPQPPLFPREPAPPDKIVKEPREHTPAGYRKILRRTEEGRLYVRSETTDWNFSLAVARERAGLNLIPEEEERFPASNWLRRFLTKGVQFLMLNSLAMRWPCRPDAPWTFQPDGSNLPRVVENLRKSDPRELERWVRHLQTVLPEIQGVTVKEREEDRYRYLVVETREGRGLPSWLLSDGTLRLFALTLLAYLPEEKGIYMVEEPENGIHPAALEAVYQSLSSVYEGQVLCATHSPILLNMAKPEEILCFARAESGATVIVPGDWHPVLKEWRREVALGDLLASGILG
jgi:predicted ATPase